MILKDSRPTIMKNLITDNDGIGLFVRDKSYGFIKGNIVFVMLYIQIKSNEIELVVEKRNSNLRNIVMENKIEGDIRIP